jgi:hypothetical protein
VAVSLAVEGGRAIRYAAAGDPQPPRAAEPASDWRDRDGWMRDAPPAHRA